MHTKPGQERHLGAIIVQPPWEIGGLFFCITLLVDSGKVVLEKRVCERFVMLVFSSKREFKCGVLRVNVSVTQAEKADFACIVFMCYCGDVTVMGSMLSLEVASQGMLPAVA